MEFAFPWPTSQGEWLAFGAAAATIALGLAHFVALLFARYPAALAARAQAAGLQVGTGAVAILMAQPLVYLALGAGWAVAALMQIVGAARHVQAGGAVLLALLAEVVLATLPIGYVFGFF